MSYTVYAMKKQIITQQKHFMNTTITIKIVQTDQRTVQILDTIDEAFGEFDRIVKKFTRFNEDSELSNLNRQPETWIQVSKEFFMLIEFILDLAKKTNGVFDPTVIDFLETYGYDKNYDFSKLDNPELDMFVKDIASKRASWKDIAIDSKNRKIKLAQNQKLDLGAVGKGYAIDCASEKLQAVSRDFLIDAGGDIRAQGNNESGNPWTVTLQSKNRDIGTIELNTQALASSGSWARKVKQFHHLLDPTTGKPVEKNYDTVFVTAPTAMQADAWATALFVGGESLEVPESLSVRFV